MTTYLVLMTGHNAANLAPLLAQWQNGDKRQIDDEIWLVPTDVAGHNAVGCFEKLLCNHRLGVKSVAKDAMGSHPRDVFEWCKRNLKCFTAPTPFQPEQTPDRDDGTGAHGQAVDGLCIVGNGGTKPMQDALTEWLYCHGLSPSRLYGEASPARLLQLRTGDAADKAWGDGPYRVGLLDVLAVAGHVLLPGCGGPVWTATELRPAIALDPLPIDAFDQPVKLACPPSRNQALVHALRNQVANELLHLLATNSALAAICSELWVAPVVHRNEDDAGHSAEWDVLLVLRNAVLVHLDCSHWFPGAPTDDTHEALASLIQRTAFCLPLPPTAPAGTLAAHCHAQYMRHRDLGRTVLPWTWPGASVVSLARGVCDDGAPRDGLAALLQIYIPPASST